MSLSKAAIVLAVLGLAVPARAQTMCVRPSEVGGHIVAGHYVTGVVTERVTELLAPPPPPGRWTPESRIEEVRRDHVRRRALVQQAVLGTVSRLGLSGDGGALTLEQAQERICRAFGLVATCDLVVTSRRAYEPRNQGDACAELPQQPPSGRGTCTVATVIPADVMAAIPGRDVIHVSNRSVVEAEYVRGVCVPPQPDEDTSQRDPAVDPVWARTRYAELRRPAPRTAARPRR